MKQSIAFFTILYDPLSKKMKPAKSFRRFLRLTLVLSICGVIGLGFLTATAEAGSCTFSSTSSEYYVPANTTKDISGCGYIYLDKPLRIRAGATLKGTKSNTTDILHADTEGAFIHMDSGSRIEGVRVNGRFKADKIITIYGQSDVWVVNCVVYNSDHTRGDLGGSKSRGSHAIHISGSQFVHIVDNAIYNAGWHPNGTPNASGSTFTAAAVYAWDSENIEISGNVIRRTLTAGIDFTGSVGVRVIDNDIRDNGLGWVAGTGGIADGITAYHNTENSRHDGIVDAVIEDNYIKNYRHWGIHVSGRGLTISNNTVITDPSAGTDSDPDTGDTDRQFSPLVIGDQRDPYTDCSVLVTVTGNDLGKPNGEDGKYTQSIFRWGPYSSGELTTSYLNGKNDLDGAIGGYQRFCSPHGATDPFSDDNNRSSERANEWAFAIDLTSGCASGRTCPTRAVKRKEMAVFMYRLLRDRPGFVEPAANANSFTDDNSLSPTYKTAIEWMKRNGITGGCTATTFCPESAVRRDHMVVFLYRALNRFKEFNPAPGGASFTDTSTSKYQKEIGWAAANGISNGCGGGRFCPAASVTREQMFVFLNRAATKTVY